MHRPCSPRGVIRGNRSGFNWGMQISQIFSPKQVRLRRTLIEKCRRRLPTIPHLYPRSHFHVAAVSGRPPPRTSPWPSRAEAPGPEALTWLRSPCGRFPGFAVTQPHPHAPSGRTHPSRGICFPPYRGRADGGRTHNIVPVGSGRPIGCHGPGRVGLVPDHEQRSRMCPLCFSTSSSLTITYVTG